jgi:predicted N-acetyltransferase YhbS
MPDEQYIFRQAQSHEDGEKLQALFTAVFHPEDLGSLARTLFDHHPRMKNQYWFMAEARDSGALAAAFALIPWTWEMEGIRLKVAEMGIVGTRAEHRGRGLMRALNRRFDQTLADEGFDLAVIQGIPGFYHHFGYRYAVSLNNHINLPLHPIPDQPDPANYTIRPAGADDIPFLMEADQTYRQAFSLASVRDAHDWAYLFAHSPQTEYGSWFWIMEDGQKQPCYFFRIFKQGFGTGLIVAEVSEDIAHPAFLDLLIFCKQKAVRLDKPYIRFDLHPGSRAAQMALSLGAQAGRPYAWQIKFPDKRRFLKTIASILEQRMEQSPFCRFSERFRLDFFDHAIDLIWEDGKLCSVARGDKTSQPHTFCIGEDLFAPLVLGHRSWRELGHTRPDIFPASEYLRPHGVSALDKTELLADTLFPPAPSWIHLPY